MKNIIFAGLILSMPLAVVAERFCVKMPSFPGMGTVPKELCFEREELFKVCPYDNCVDRCVGGGMAAPCNPMDLCDPGLVCALGCAVACR